MSGFVVLYRVFHSIANTCSQPPETPTVLSLPEETIVKQPLLISRVYNGFALPPTIVMLLTSAKLYASPHCTPAYESMVLGTFRKAVETTNTPTVTAVLAVEHPSGMKCGLYDIWIVAITKCSRQFGYSGRTFFRLCVCIGH